MNKQIIIYKKECYNEPHCSLNQVLEQLEAYKMEAEEGREINAELEAKNEELKKTCDILALKRKRDFSDYQFQNNELKQQLDQLKKENEELKEEFKLFQQLKDEDSFRVVELSSENVKLKHQLDLYKNSHKTEQDRRRVFEQTLAEIKEIAENNKHSVLCFTAFEGDAIEVNNKPMTAILQKIDKVEDDLV